MEDCIKSLVCLLEFPFVGSNSSALPCIQLPRLLILSVEAALLVVMEGEGGGGGEGEQIVDWEVEFKESFGLPNIYSAFSFKSLKRILINTLRQDVFRSVETG